MTDNAELSYFYSDLSSTMQTYSNWNIATNIRPTDLTDVKQTSVTAYTDLIVADSHYSTACGLAWMTPSNPTGVIGLSRCTMVLANYRCGTQRVYYNNHYTDGASAFQKRSLACHEMGHAIGLKHMVGASCMESGTQDSNTFTSHDVAHINSAF